MQYIIQLWLKVKWLPWKWQHNSASYLKMFRAQNYTKFHAIVKNWNIFSICLCSKRHVKQFLRERCDFSSAMFMHSVFMCKYCSQCRLSIFPFAPLQQIFMATLSKNVWQDVPCNMLHVLSPSGTQGRNLGRLKIITRNYMSCHFCHYNDLKV